MPIASDTGERASVVECRIGIVSDRQFEPGQSWSGDRRTRAAGDAR